jgi:acyl-CoA thioesterase FadM
MQDLQLERTDTWRLRPRYAGANIRTWIGFKHFMYLVEEAVLNWFRERGWGPQDLYHRYGAGLEIIDSSVLLPSVLEIDDEVDARVSWLEPGRFGVRMTVMRAGKVVTVLRGRIAVALVTEPQASAIAAAPECLAPLVVPTVSALAQPVAPPPQATPFGWQWRARYFHCHYSDRVQHGSYVQALEEVVDRFLAQRGLSVPRMLAQRGWIPVVSRARVRLLADAHMDEQIRTTFAVTEIVKDRAFDGRMDSYVIGSDHPRHVATAQILHGYATSRGQAAGTLTELDPATVKALTGQVP